MKGIGVHLGKSGKGNLIHCFVVAAIALCALSASAAGKAKVHKGTQTKTCPQGSTLFGGVCVQASECCLEGVCGPGEVFEYRERPICVACEKAEMTNAMRWCAQQRAESTFADAERLAAEAARRFPAEASRSKSIQAAWKTFVTKLCEAESLPFQGGSMEGVVLKQCQARENLIQAKRWEDVIAAWSVQ